MLLAIISIFASIYLGLKIPKKKINYLFAQKGNDYILAFWNAGKLPIYENDIFRLYIKGGKKSNCSIIYSTDIDIMPTIQEYKEQFEYGFIGNKWDINFSFLIPKNGFIFEIYNNENKPKEGAKLYLNGRIKGEDINSVSYADKDSIIDENKNNKSRNKIKSNLKSIIALAYPILQIHYLRLPIPEQQHNIVMLIIIIISILQFYISVKWTIKGIMPYKLRKKFNQLCKQHGAYKSKIYKSDNLFIIK